MKAVRAVPIDAGPPGCAPVDGARHIRPEDARRFRRAFSFGETSIEANRAAG
jgi:hypothetical protein